MKAKTYIRSIIFALGLAALSACGGGGDDKPSQPPVVPPPVAVAAAVVVIPVMVEQWFHTAAPAADGSEMLMLSTIDSSNIYNLTAATAMMAIKTDDTGTVNVTSQVFESTPKTFWARNLVPFVDDTGTPSVYVCNQGRETRTPGTANGIDGVWAEQDRLLVMRNGKYVDESDKLPQAIDFTHGCTVANMGDGKKSLVKNRFGGVQQKSLLTLVNGRYEISADLDEAAVEQNRKGTFAVAAADFAKTGTDDLVFGNLIIRKSGNSYAKVAKIDPPAEYAASGYTIVHNLLAADVNGDSFPDLIATYSGDGEVANGPSFLSGAKLAVYLNDKAGNLVLKEGAIPSMSETEMGLTIRAMDITFDGKIDITTSGNRYIYSSKTNVADAYVKTVLLGNGDGTFTNKVLADPALNKQCARECQIAMYLLKNTDDTFNILASGKNAGGEVIIYSRKVTSATPLMTQ